MSALEVATAIAAALGDGWRAEAWEHHEWSAFLRHADGRGLFLEGWSLKAKGRFVVEGVYPRGWVPRQGEELSVTVSACRDPVAVARDLARRMLPRYGELLEVARERCAAQDRAAAARDAVAAAVMAAVPGSYLERGNTVPVVVLGRPFGYGSKARTGWSAESVDLVLKDVPAGAAAGVVRLLAAGVAAQDPGGTVPQQGSHAGARGLSRFRRAHKRVPEASSSGQLWLPGRVAGFCCQGCGHPVLPAHGAFRESCP
jgi:hypothetical protein